MNSRVAFAGDKGSATGDFITANKNKYGKYTVCRGWPPYHWVVGRLLCFSYGCDHSFAANNSSCNNNSKGYEGQESAVGDQEGANLSINDKFIHHEIDKSSVYYHFP